MKKLFSDDMNKGFSYIHKSFSLSVICFLLSGLIISRLFFIIGFERRTGILIITVLLLALVLYYCFRMIKFASTNNEIVFFSIVYGVPACYGFSFFLPFTRSIVWLILFAMCACTIYHVFCFHVSKRTYLASASLAILFSAFIFVGYQLVNYGRFELMYFTSWSEPKFINLFLLLFCGFGLFFFFHIILMFVLQKLSSLNFCMDYHCLKWPLPLRLLLLTSIIFICYLPYFISNYPGIISPDSAQEIYQQLGYDPLSNHHPIVHQIFIGCCLKIGAIFESLELGVAVYSLTQMIFLAFVFALSVDYIFILSGNVFLCTGILLFYAFFMVNGFFSVTMWKDVPFAAFCLLFTLLLTDEIIREKRQLKEKLFSIIGLITVGFMLCTMRNNGYYAFILGFPVFIFFNRKNFKKYAIVYLSLLLIVSSYQKLIFDDLGVVKSRTAESLSVPLQQIARTEMLHGSEEQSSIEFEILSEVFYNLDKLGDVYKSFLSDPVKSVESFNSEQFDTDPLRYLGCWARLGLRHPTTYIDAFLLQCYGYWYPDLDIGIVSTGVFDYANRLELEPSQKNSALKNKLLDTKHDIGSSQPTAIFYSCALMIWIIFLAAALMIINLQYDLMSLCAIPAAIWLTTLLSPVFLEYRYVYSLSVCAPFLIALAIVYKSNQVHYSKH